MNDRIYMALSMRIPHVHLSTNLTVVDVLEGLAEALHPDLFEGLAPKGVFARLEN